MEEWDEIGSMLLSEVFLPVNMLSAEALHERWPFGHLSSYLFRS